MMDFALAAVPSVLATVAVGLMAKISKSLVSFTHEHSDLMAMKGAIDKMASEHEALMECNRNQNKNEIVGLYQGAVQRGYITPFELDCANRLADSYFELGGNHYIHALIGRMNDEMPIVGEPIPEERT